MITYSGNFNHNTGYYLIFSLLFSSIISLYFKIASRYFSTSFFPFSVITITSLGLSLKNLVFISINPLFSKIFRLTDKVDLFIPKFFCNSLNVIVFIPVKASNIPTLMGDENIGSYKISINSLRFSISPHH